MNGNKWTVSPYNKDLDIDWIQSVLVENIVKLYPNGKNWLANRLDELDSISLTRAYVVRDENKPVAISIEICPENEYKLATFWIDPDYRSQGIGNVLMDNCVERWKTGNLNKVQATCAKEVWPVISPLFERVGFHIEKIVEDRYGKGRDEIYLTWSPN